MSSRCCGPRSFASSICRGTAWRFCPLDGTFTPMPNGDYLWRVNDHGMTRREICAPLQVRRRSLRRVRQGHAADVPLREADPQHGSTRPDDAQSQRPDEAAVPRPPIQRPERRRQIQPGAAHDHERHRFPRSVVRDRRAQGHDVGVGNHRHVSRGALARNRLRPAPPLHGRDRRSISRLGLCARRHRRHFKRHRRRRPRSWSGNPHASGSCADPGQRRQGGRRRDDRTATSSTRR